MSRKHKHRADNRPASRRYIARSLARLQQHLDSTVIQATGAEPHAHVGRCSSCPEPVRLREVTG